MSVSAKKRPPIGGLICGIAVTNFLGIAARQVFLWRQTFRLSLLAMKLSVLRDDPNGRSALNRETE